VPDNDDIAILMGALTAFNDNDMDRVEQFVAEDVVYTIHGQASVSGVYKGRRAMGDALRHIKDLTGGTIATNPEVMLAENGNVMIYSRITGSRPDGRTYEQPQAYLYRMRDGLLIEGETIPVDQQAFAEFFAD
jgi:ketosteroid isomerase-like protein